MSSEFFKKVLPLFESKQEVKPKGETNHGEYCCCDACLDTCPHCGHKGTGAHKCPSKKFGKYSDEKPFDNIKTDKKVTAESLARKYKKFVAESEIAESSYAVLMQKNGKGEYKDIGTIETNKPYADKYYADRTKKSGHNFKLVPHASGSKSNLGESELYDTEDLEWCEECGMDTQHDEYDACTVCGEEKGESITKKLDRWDQEDAEDGMFEDSALIPFVAVHVKKGKTKVYASSTYEAAKKAAEKWKLKNTSGIDVYKSDVVQQMNEAKANYDIGDDNLTEEIEFRKNLISRLDKLGQDSKKSIIGLNNQLRAIKKGNK
jgi:hypothetical protein